MMAFMKKTAFNLSVSESVLLRASWGAEGLTESPFLPTLPGLEDALKENEGRGVSLA